MMQYQDAMNELKNMEMLKKNLNLETLGKKSDEVRFMMILRYLEKHRGCDYWMSKIKTCKTTKSAKLSEQFRKEGNRQYVDSGADRLSSAIESFTKSVAYAPLESAELSLAYANRSAVLMKAQLYDDALADIRRALKSGYPDRLKAKLFARRAVCLRALSADDTADVQKALENARGWLKRMERKHPSRRMVEEVLNDPDKLRSLPPSRFKWNPERFTSTGYEENPEIVGASKAIAVRYTRKNECQFVATRSIKPGEILTMQMPYASYLDDARRYTNCWQCLAQTWSGIPCNYCHWTVYCSEACRDAAWAEHHSIECQVPALNSVINIDASPSDAFGCIVMRMVIRAVREAGSFQALKDAVKRIEANPDVMKKGYTGSAFDGSTFESVYTLPTRVELRPGHMVMEVAYRSAFVALLMATKSKFFGEELSLRQFFRHEWVPFVGGLMTRFHLITIGALQDEYDALNSVTPAKRAVTLRPLHARLPHSCAPNVSRTLFGTKMAVYAHQPIAKGEQLFCSRGQLFDASPREVRQQDIGELFGTACRCVACTGNWPMSDLPRCDMAMPDRVLESYVDILESGEERMRLSMQGYLPVIAKFLSDLSSVSTAMWKYVRLPCYEVNRIVTYINRLYLILGSRRDLF